MKRSKFLLLSVILIVGMLFSVSNALAYTAANTEITNQASATFDDAEGDGHSVTSNQVITTVLPIYGLTITPDGTEASPGQSQSGSPGQTVYFQYVLTNTGNDQDSYTLDHIEGSSDDFDPDSVKVYRDVNGNGIVEPGEPLAYSYDGSGVGVLNVDPNQSVKLVMQYKIPVGQTDGEFTNVDLQGTSQGDPGEVDNGNFNRTTVIGDAIIVANKSVNVANASPGDTLTYTINASNSGNLPTTEDTLDVNGTDYYGVIIADVLPLHNSYPFRIIDGSASGTPNSGNAIYWVGTSSPAYSDSLKNWPSGTWYASLTDAINAEDGSTDNYVRAIGWITGGTTHGDGVILSGQNYSFTYQLRIAVDYPAGTVENTARLEYDRSDSTQQETITNTVTTDVGGDGYEVLATMAYPSDSDVYAGLEDIANAHDLAVTGQDTLTVDSQVDAGDDTTYIFTVTNHGFSDDIINLQLGDKPSSWSFGFYYMDGVTPLGDTNTDGLVDVGTLAPGASYTFKVRVGIGANQPTGTDSLVYFYAQSATAPIVTDLPSINTTANAYTNSNGTAPDTLTLADASGLSVGDFVNITTSGGNKVRRISAIDGNKIVVPDLDANVAGSAVVTGKITKYNKTAILFEDIQGAGVVYTNDDYSHAKDFDAHPADSLYVDMPLRIQNPAENNDTYTLTDSLPDSWTVKYYHDADCGSDLDAGEMTEISDISVAGNGEKCVFARVFYPLNTEATTVDSIVKFVATSTNNTTIKDTIYNNVTIHEVCDVVFSPNRQATASPGYTVEYFHNLMNTGNTPLAATTSYFEVNSPRGWSYVLYQENPSTADQWDQLTLNGSDQYELAHEVGINATADSTSRIKVKVFIPTNAPDSQVELGTITFTADCGASDYVEDETTVVVSNLLLQKRVVNQNAAPDTAWADAANNNTGAPLDTLIYYVYFKNISSGSVDTLMIYDAIPANTTYVPGSATFCDENGNAIGSGDAPDEIVYSLDNGSNWGSTENTSVTNIRYSYYDNDGSIGDWIPLPSGNDGYIKFKVTID